MPEPFRVAIFEADNRLVGFHPPSFNDLMKYPSGGIADYLNNFLYGSGFTRKRLGKRPSGAMPLQGPVLAANLLKKKYNGKAVVVTVYIPGISEEASTLAGVGEIIKRSCIVAVSSLSVNAWAQKEIIRIAKEEGKKVIATGAHVRMYEPAKRMLERGTKDNPTKMPESRHMDYNDRQVVFPGADYVIQHNQYNAFLDIVELIMQGADSPGTVKSIKGVGYRDSEGNIKGLTERPCDMIVPETPDVVYDPKVIDGYDTKLKAISITGSGQGCINACHFCQIKRFMGDNFIHNPPGLVYHNLLALHKAGILKEEFNPLKGTMNNSVFFSDDSPILGGPLEADMPFDYVEFSKILDYIGSLKLKKKRKKVAASAPVVELPGEVIAYIQMRNPAMLIRMKNLGLSYARGEKLASKKSVQVNLLGASLEEAVKYLQVVATTRTDNPRLRPFSRKDVPDADPLEKMGRQLRKNYVEFSKMLDEIGQFERDHNCKPSFYILMSIRAIIFLQRHNPYALQRMHDLGFDNIPGGYEDIIHKDNKGISGIVKSTGKENKEAASLVKAAGMVTVAMLVIPVEIYELGDVRKTAEKALEMGINCVQIWSEQPYDGTHSTEGHIEKKRCLFQLGGGLFDGPWRDLVYGLQTGEITTMKPNNASMLGLQLDLLDAIIFFNKLSHHLPLFKKEFRKKGWKTALYGLGLPTIELAAMARDLVKWLFHTPIREGKNYIQILSQIDPRWKKEEYTLTLVRKFGLEEMLRGE